MDQLARRLHLTFSAIGNVVLRLMLRPQLVPCVVPTKE